MKKFLKVLGYIFLWLVAFVVIVFVIVWITTSWIDEKANNVIFNIKQWKIESLFNELHSIEVENNVANQLTIEELKNAIVLPNWKADLRTLGDVNWDTRWFENGIKYIEWEWVLWSWLKIRIRLEFIEKDDNYIFYGITWKQVQ
jgi:hypothetical protein